jgi:hypothetical protein
MLFMISFMISLALLSFTTYVMPTSAHYERQMNSVQTSHIQAHTPDAGEFHRLLDRDLGVYFRSHGTDISVTHQMLRDVPTQVGVGSLKFYVWATVTQNGVIVQEGAARLAAVDKSEFIVLNFIGKAELMKNPTIAEGVFPSALLPKIHTFAGIEG